jgi:hypothetical protein
VTEPPEHPGLGALTKNVIALGTEVESLRRITELLRRRLAERTEADDELDRQLRATTSTLAGLAEQLAELAARVDELEEEDEAVKLSRRSLFDLDDPAAVYSRLIHLVPWVSRVYLRYPESTLASCWLWHPDVVEELLWLHRSWTEAYQGKTASTQGAADWHERHRPGVARRIGSVLKTCGLELHAAGAELDRLLPRAPVADEQTLGHLATRWAESQTAPVPTADQLAEARAPR